MFGSRRRALKARARSGSREPLPASCSRRAGASSSSCPGRRASFSGSGSGRSRPSLSGVSSPVRRIAAGERCASSARRSRRSRRCSQRQAGMATASRPRSARASSRSTSTSSSSRGPSNARTCSRTHFARHSARHLFSEDDRSIAEIVLDLARARGLSVVTAESCTGGLVAARLTAVPGASDVFRGGVVAYSNAVKEAELGVSLEPARGARRRVR